jgi:hypothetical protein
VAQYNAYHFPAGGSSSDGSIGAGPNLASIAVGSTGEVSLATSDGVVSTYAAGQTTGVPARAIVTGKIVRSIAVTDATTFVLESTGAVAEFAASATGSAPPAASFTPTTASQTANAIAVDMNADPPILYVAADGPTSGLVLAVPLMGSAPAYTPGTPTSLQGTLTTLSSAASVFVVHY